jgi:hypothetical protein
VFSHHLVKLPHHFYTNQFAVFSESESDIEEDGVQPQTLVHRARIPPIVIYSYLNNHSATLKQVNDKLSTPVDVK